MARLNVAPGPNANDAFRLGVIVAALAGLVPLAVLYAHGALPLLLVGFVLLTLFPVYLIFSASALSVWLGFDKDATDLRPVYRNRE
jgi:hypothetical protein